MLRRTVLALLLTSACNGAGASAPSSAPDGGPECKLNSNGTQTCGYNCKLGSGGSWFCASTPDGQCALQATGTWACP